MRTLQARLTWARNKTGLSQRRLSELAGIADRLVSLIERGERENPELKTVSALAAALGVSVGWLANGEGQQPDESDIRSSVAALEKSKKGAA